MNRITGYNYWQTRDVYRKKRDIHCRFCGLETDEYLTVWNLYWGINEQVWQAGMLTDQHKNQRQFSFPVTRHCWREPVLWEVWNVISHSSLSGISASARWCHAAFSLIIVLALNWVSQTEWRHPTTHNTCLTADGLCILWTSEEILSGNLRKRHVTPSREMN